MPESTHPPTTSTTGARASDPKTQALASTPVAVPNDCHEVMINLTVPAWWTVAADASSATTKLAADATRFRMPAGAFTLGCRQMKERGVYYWFVAESDSGEISTARTYS